MKPEITVFQAELLETLLNVEYQFVAQFNHFLGLFDVFCPCWS